VTRLAPACRSVKLRGDWGEYCQLDGKQQVPSLPIERVARAVVLTEKGNIMRGLVRQVATMLSTAGRLAAC
jgi:hypothetical protein